MTKVGDWDAWTHLALGRDLVQRGGFPATEPFTFPSTALPYFNTEWLFDVMFYVAYLVGGFAGVILLKAALASLTAFILWKDSALGRDTTPDPTLDIAIRAAVLFPALFMIWYRFVERPDLVLMVFLTFTIYALNAYLYEGRRYLYALPAIQLLWVNMHPSALLAFVPFGAFLVGGQSLRLIQRWRGGPLPGTPTLAQLRKVAGVFAAVVVASLVNPYGFHVLTEPFRLAGSSWFQQNIRELQAPPILGLPAPFILTALFVVTSLVTARRFPIMSILLVAPFAYLGMSAVRFVFLLVIVAAPVLVRHLSVTAAMLTRTWVRRTSLGVASSAGLTAIVAIGLAVAHVEPLSDPTKLPGIGVNDRFLPERALRYLDAAGIAGRILNTYHWGGYLAWRDFPRRAPIIDGRGYVPPGLLETIQAATTDPAVLERLHAMHDFDIILINHPGMPTEVAGGPDTATGSRWALVYWDDVAVVFLRRSPRWAQIIARDEYHYVNPADGVPHLMRALADDSKFAAIQTELRRNIAQTESAIGFALLGFAHLQQRDYDRAIETFRRAQDYSAVWHASQGLALAYWQKGDLPRAIGHYKALASISDDPTLQFNIGLALVQSGNDREAVRYLERARARNARFTPIYPVLIDAYQRLGQSDRQQELRHAHARAITFGRVSEHLRKASQLDREGKPDAAIAEIRAALQLDPRNARVLSRLGDIHFHQGRLDAALAQQRAAVELEPNFADAHYRLALIHQRRADHASARRHFEEYVRLEPNSSLSWRAREELSRLPR